MRYKQCGIQYKTTNSLEKAMVTLSFDDGREDTYRVAYSIMKKYGLVGTIHVTTGWVDKTWSTNDWPSAVNGPMTIDEIRECYNKGFEITSHGDKHITEETDLKVSLEKLKNWGVIDLQCLGLSSPNSELNTDKMLKMFNVFKSNNIQFVRSGRSEKCYSLGMKIIYWLQTITTSKQLFILFNRNNNIISSKINKYMLPSTVVKSNNSAEQVIGLLDDSINTKCWNIIMLHSILNKGEKGYGKDNWYWDAEKFEKLCQWLSSKNGKEISVVTMGQGFKKNFNS